MKIKISNNLFSLIKTLVFFLTFIILSENLLSQEYVKLTSSTTKKEYQQSENIKVTVKATVQEGYHINANKISDEDLIPTTLKLTGNDFKLIKVSWPSAKKYKFSFSETELDVYEGSFTITLTLKARKNLQPAKYEIAGIVNYQACNDRSCFAPIDAEFSTTIVIIQDSVKTDTTKTDTSKVDTSSRTETKISNPTDTSTITKKSSDGESTKTTVGNDNQISGYVKEKGYFLTFLLLFLGGLALNLTPCVYPLIPITISFFGAKQDSTKTQQISHAIVYVLGISITYSLLGLIAALTGGLFGSALQNPIVIVVIVLILLGLAISMFGFYEIRIPQSIAAFSSKNRQGYFGSALMGLTVGFIAAPCIGPFVLSLLVYVGQIGDAFLGFMMFFVLSLGLGFPYIFLAIFSGSISKLPRSGEWMEGVKTIFGFVMIGLALYTAQPLIPSDTYKVLFPFYLIVAGIYLIIIDKKGMNAAGYTKIKYVIAIGSIIVGSMNLELEKQQNISKNLEWQELHSLQQIESSIKNSGEKPTIIDFYADWCAQCKELDKYTYVDPKVIELSKKFNNIKIDLTKENKEISDKFKILGLPVVAFINKNGNEITELRVTGFLKPDEFITIMEKANKK